MAADQPHESSIFHAVRKLASPQERAAFLIESCGDDVVLRERVEKLVAAYDEQSQYLEQPAPGLPPNRLAGPDSLDRAASLDAGLTAAFDKNQAVVVGDGHHSVLKLLGQTLEKVPRVVLREWNEGGSEPITRSKSAEMPKPDSDSRYQLQGEIARGGMGAIIKGRDTDLGRDLAIKVLLDQHKDKPEIIARFVEEAQIGGQLQHPGIAPIYELGQFSDRRPFFSMKLVKGQTFAKLLTERKDAAEDRGRFLGIFEQVCQTMAYAHSRGVIHRDLKPANIMVGAFGEVQVMDWGLAKVLPIGGVADERRSLQLHHDKSIIQTVRSGVGSDAPDVGSLGSQTRIGSVMGTPAYMPPEQALGEIDNLDERADVFGLGAILCEILTGQPPYVADDGTRVYRMASRGKLADCFARLDASSADAELIALTKHCLALEPKDRPRDAGSLAERVSGYLESVEAKLRASEVDRAAQAARADAEAAQALAERQRAEAESHRAEAESAKAQAESARASAESKRRRTSLALAASVLLLVAVGSGGWLHLLRQEADRQTAEATAQRKHADEMQSLAEQRDEQRKEAIAARQRETDLRKVAEEKQQEAQQRYYAADSSNASFAVRNANQFGRLTSYLNRWKSESDVVRDWEYYLIESQVRVPDQEFDFRNKKSSGFGHFYDVSWSPTGRRIATGCTRQTVEVYDAAFGERQWETRVWGVPRSVDWSSDGRRIAAGTEEGSVFVFSSDTGEILNSFSVSTYVHRVRWSPDGTRIAMCHGPRVQIWHADRGELLTEFSHNTAGVINVHWDREGRRVASCTHDGEVMISHVDQGKDAQTWRIEGGVSAWDWNPRTGQMAFGSTTTKTVAIWDVASQTIVSTCNDEAFGSLVDLALSPDGEQLVAIGGGTRTLWETRSGQLLDRAAQFDGLMAVAWSKDGKMLANVGTGEQVQIWSASQTTRPHRLPDAQKFSWGSEGKVFATSQGKTITVWDAYLWQPLRSINGHQSPLTALALSPDERLIVSSDDQGSVYVWDLGNGELTHKMTMADNKAVTDLAFSPDQKWLSGLVLNSTLTGMDRKFVLWEVGTWNPRDIAPPLVHHCRQAWSPNSQQFLVTRFATGYSGNFGDISVGTGAVTDGPRWFMARASDWSGDGRQVVLASGEHNLNIVDYPSFTNPRTIHSAHSKLVQSVDWSPTLKRIVSVGADRLARIWDVDTLQPVYEIENALDARWCPYGLRLAVQTPLGVEIHDASRGAARQRWKHLLPMLVKKLGLGRSTIDEFKTLIELQIQQQDWEAALDGTEALMLRDPDQLLSRQFSAEVYMQYAGATKDLVRGPGHFTDQQADTNRQRELLPTGGVSADASTSRKSIDGQRDAQPYLVKARQIYSTLLAVEPQNPFFLKRLETVNRCFTVAETEEWLHTLEQDSANKDAVVSQRFQQGKALLKDGNAEAAGRQFTAILQVTDDSELRQRILNTSRSSLSLLEHLASSFPDDADYLAARGEARFRQNKPAEARVDLEKSIAILPTERAVRTLADLLQSESGEAGEWTAVKPMEMTSKGGATLTGLDDNSVLVSGATPNQDVYTTTLLPGEGTIHAICVEAIPDPSLIQFGPGRGGNFSLTQFELIHGEKAVGFSSACATFEQDSNHSAAAAIDEDPNKGWAIWPRTGRAHRLYLRLKEPISLAESESIRVNLHFQENSRHTLGRFRLLVTNDPDTFVRDKARLPALRTNNSWLRLALVQSFVGETKNSTVNFIEAYRRAVNDHQRAEVFDHLYKHDELLPEFIRQLAKELGTSETETMALGASLLSRHGFIEAARKQYAQLAKLEPRNSLWSERLALVTPETIALWNFDSGTEGWHSLRFVSLTAADGSLTPINTGHDPHFGVNVASPAGWQVLTFRARNKVPLEMQLFWSTTAHTIEEAHTQFLKIPKSAETWTEHRYCFRSEGELLKLRLDPGFGEGKQIEFDWIRLERFPEGWDQDARERLTSLVESGRARPEDLKQLAELLEGLDVAVGRQRYQEILNAGIQSHPNHIPLRLSRGRLNAAQQQWQAVIDDLNVAITAETTDAALFALRAHAHKQLKQWDAAVEDLTQALRFAPNEYAYLESRAQLVSYHQGRPEQSLSDWSRLIELSPTNAWLWMERSTKYYSLGQKEKAVADINRAVAIGTPADLWHSLRIRGEYLAQEGEWRKAAEDLDRAFPLNAAEWARFELFRSQTLLQLMVNNTQGYQSGFARLDEYLATQTDAEQLQWLVLLAVATPSVVTEKNADRLFKITDEQLGGNYAAWQPRLRAALHYRLGELERATELWGEQADGPATGAFHFLAAMAHHKLGHKEQARKLFDKANLSIKGQESKQVGAAIPSQQSWQYWVICQSLQREATKLLMESGQQE